MSGMMAAMPPPAAQRALLSQVASSVKVQIRPWHKADGSKTQMRPLASVQGVVVLLLQGTVVPLTSARHAPDTRAAGSGWAWAERGWRVSCGLFQRIDKVIRVCIVQVCIAKLVIRHT